MHIYPFSHNKVHILKFQHWHFSINVISKITNSEKNNYFLVFVILEHLPYVPKNLFSYFSTKTYVVGTQKNRLMETFFEHPKHMLELMGEKIFTILC